MKSDQMKRVNYLALNDPDAQKCDPNWNAIYKTVQHQWVDMLIFFLILYWIEIVTEFTDP